MKKRVVISSVLSILFIGLMFSFFKPKLSFDDNLTETTFGESTITESNPWFFKYYTGPYTQPTDDLDSGSVVIEDNIMTIKNSKYTFVIEKTDFEDRYSEEELFGFLNFIPMSFGYEDYYNWNGSGEDILIDTFHCCISCPNYNKNMFKSYSLHDEEGFDVAKAEIGDDYRGFCVTTIDEINSFLSRWYGPDVRQLTKDDFMNIKDAKASGEPLISGSDMEFSVYYLPESDLIAISLLETGFGCYTSYIYNIEEVNDDLVMYTFDSVENYVSNESFAEHQEDLYDHISWGNYWYKSNSVYTLSKNSDGEWYLKSTEKSFIVAEEKSPNYIVVSEDEEIEVKNRYALSEDLNTVGYLQDGDEVYFSHIGMYDRKEYAYIIAKDFSGFIDPVYLQEIE